MILIRSMSSVDNLCLKEACHLKILIKGVVLLDGIH